ncbi:binding-protein-dependent transport systems inner membrane component [Catenulispora acidiphila DSM 44928]|uniref:Binding-protein-dependent transport systems inner membrane component n=1 Tax=Catenulispora acidiphila (strain DSM 44928 / JCM 14897 / NBRC 102108 / NRRL B-24433 / ID139908) TaxID=479433 RepID=C7QKP3_CATAD|nr:ABC transporter permease [Catenulispora acidiphila]ACU77142.1 binding-protein-dependent transport systems inner membrane component [Catenulispora acidiphila DSM 44928]
MDEIAVESPGAGESFPSTEQMLGLEPTEKPRSMFRRGLEVFLENRLAVVAFGVLVFYVVLCFLGPLVYHGNTSNVQMDEITLAPGPSHPLGTDQNGVDELGKLMKAGQISLEIGIASGVLASVIGMLYGAIAGYVGGWVDSIMMRTIDALLSIPLIFALIYIASTRGRTKMVFILVIALTSWFGLTRLTRGDTLTIKVRDYVAACRMMGGRSPRIIFRHILPNTIGTTIVNTSLSIANSVFALSVLSYIGLGLQAPNDDWGGMFANGSSYLDQNFWWMIYPPGVSIVLIIISCNFIGDALRDAFETRLQKR